jgi:hypothetical protein
MRQSLEDETGYRFYFDGYTVIIGSKNAPKGGGNPYNIIISDKLNFKAVDFSQDARIDEVVEGNLTIEEVQRIYDYGLQAATKQGKLRKIEWEQTYKLTEGNHTYTLRSYQPLNDWPYNEFLMTGPMRLKIKALDKGADGTIDYVLEGHQVSIVEIQEFYEKLLLRGIANNKLEFIDGRYRVKTDKPTPSPEIQIQFEPDVA